MHQLTRTAPNRQLNQVVQAVVKAHQQRKPSLVFGDTIPEYLTFHDPHAEIFIKHECLGIIAEANDAVSSAFPSSLTSDWLWGRCETARATFDAHHSGYFTYMKTPCRAPWETQQQPVKESTRGNHVALPQIDVTEGSNAWIWAVVVALGGEEAALEDPATHGLRREAPKSVEHFRRLPKSEVVRPRQVAQSSSHWQY